MLEYVRVRDKSTDHRYSVLAQEAANHPDAYEVLADEPAVNANGDPLPGEIPGAPVEQPEEGPPQGYEAWKVPDLKAEVERRNSDRDPASHVDVEEPGNKPQLAAALSADDLKADTIPVAGTAGESTATTQEN